MKMIFDWMLMIDVFFWKNLIKWICMKAVQQSPDDVRKSFKWMWCCYQTMSRQAVDFDVKSAAPNADTIRCTDGWMWCQNCCTRPWNGQMHAGDCLKKLPELHLMPMPSDALTIVCNENPLQSADCNVIRDKVEEAKTRCWCNVIRYDIQGFAPDAEIVECTDDFVWIFRWLKIHVRIRS